MEIFIKENGIKEKLMAKVLLSRKELLFILASGKMINNMVKEKKRGNQVQSSIQGTF